MLVLNGLAVMQDGQKYHLFTPQGIMIAQLYMGADGQLLRDAVAIKGITHIMANRWDIPNSRNRSGR